MVIMPRVAFAEPNNCKICSFKNTKTLYYIYSIFRTCWSKSATWWKHRRNKISI